MMNRDQEHARRRLWLMIGALALLTAALAYFLPAPSIWTPAVGGQTPPLSSAPASISTAGDAALVAMAGQEPVSKAAWQQGRAYAEVTLRLLAPPGASLDEAVVLQSYLEDVLIAQEARRAGFDVDSKAVASEEERMLQVAGATETDLDKLLSEVGLSKKAWQTELRRSVLASRYLEDVVLADVPIRERGERRATWLAALKQEHPIRLLSVASSAKEAPRPGHPAPDFTLPALAGETMRLNSLRGQAVVLNFWATWCPACRQEMPLLEQAYRDHRSQGLVILGVNVGEGRTGVQKFVDELGLSFPIVLDGDQKVTRRYRVYGLPTSFFIDRQGVVRELVIGQVPDEQALGARLEPILMSLSAPKSTD